MKKLLLLVVLAVGAWLGWTRFQPIRFDGDQVPEGSRVIHASGDGLFSAADKIEPDVWTLVLFASSETTDERTLARRLEVAVRQDFDTIRLIIVDVRGLDSPAAQQHGLTELPALWLYDGYRQVTKRRADIERALFGD